MTIRGCFVPERNERNGHKPGICAIYMNKTPNAFDQDILSTVPINTGRFVALSMIA